MKLIPRLVLAFTVVALLAVGLTTALGYGASLERFRLLQEAGYLRPPPGSSPAERAALRVEIVRVVWSSQVTSGLLALGGAALVGVALAYSLARPLRNLTRATQLYAEGERQLLLPTRGRGEVAELARAFEHLTGRLSAEEARERQLFADIAHELRTPLTVIRGDLESLSDGLLDPTPANIERLLGEVDALTRLVGDLRLLSVAGAGELTLDVRDLDLSVVLAEVVDGFEGRSARKGVRLSRDLSAAPLAGDAGRLRQLGVNLLENAVRHAPEGGHVHVGVASWAGQVHLTVEDDGPGIPEEERERIFERFYRVDYARQRETGGSGLGLAIARVLVERHGGTIRALERPGGGARFEVNLPGFPGA